MIVILNNGTRVVVPKEFVQRMVQDMAAGNTKQWQINMNTDSKEILQVINLKDVSIICTVEDVVDGLE